MVNIHRLLHPLDFTYHVLLFLLSHVNNQLSISPYSNPFYFLGCISKCRYQYTSPYVFQRAYCLLDRVHCLFSVFFFQCKISIPAAHNSSIHSLNCGKRIHLCNPNTYWDIDHYHFPQRFLHVLSIHSPCRSPCCHSHPDPWQLLRSPPQFSSACPGVSCQQNHTVYMVYEACFSIVLLSLSMLLVYL